MEIPKELKEFLKNHTEELNSRNFDELYQDLIGDYPIGFLRIFNKLLELVNVNPLDYLTVIPARFYLNTTMTNASLRLPSNISEIHAKAFSGSTIKDIDIAASVKVIESGVFAWCHNLEKVTLHNGLEIIFDDAFYDCIKLKSIVIPDTVTIIRESAFANCTGLTSVKLSDHLEILPSGLFAYCTALPMVVIPQSIKTWQGNAFYKCTALTSVIIPEVDTTVESCFYGCNALKNIKYAGTNESFANAFKNDFISDPENGPINVMCTDGLYQYKHIYN